jgi:hypothetical protein
LRRARQHVSVGKNERGQRVVSLTELVLTALVDRFFSACTVSVMATVLFVMAACLTTQAATPAGTTINNSASATYVDPAAPGTPYSATSNTITLRVAEVAGITVTPRATAAVGGGLIVPGGQVNFDFTVSNTGNGTNAFSIPNTAIVGGTAGSTIVGTPEISYDGGVTFTPLATAAGTFSGSGATGRLQTTSIPAGGSVIVRIVTTIPANSTQNQTITAQLGNTGANDNSAATQNQSYAAGDTGNVFTTNNASEPSPGPPLNGQREAAAFSSTMVQARMQAFAQLLKSGAIATSNVDPQLDTIVYALTLNVLASYPSAGPAYIAAPLVATAMQLNGASAQRVFVSDVVPAQTLLSAVAAPPSGWTVVYSTDATSVATTAAFTTTAPGNLATVKRIGWIAAGPVPLGSAIAGFGFTVVASGVPAAAASTVLNIAQVFGQSQGDPTNLLVYDQSGDQFPSNFSAGNGSPGSSAPLGTAPANGVAPVSGPNDPGGNTGVAGGDNNVVNLAPQTALVNGPSGVPGALGPDGTNATDVTIQTVTVPAGLPPASGLPVPLQSAFTNTIGNTGTVPLLNVTLVPQLPVAPAGLPNGTTAAISWSGQATAAVYTYTSTSGWTLTGGSPVSIPSVAAGGTQNYSVVVTLPAGTAQSTNGGAAANGFPVPILASSTTPFGTSTNLTTDTTYTGFVKLTKLAQVFNADGSACDLAPTPAPNPACVVAGNFVQYTIAYANIIPASVGSGSTAPAASHMTIVEDGQAPPNTFAQLFGNVLVTSAVQGTAHDSTAGNTLTYFNAVGQNVGDIAGSGTATGDVTKYVDTFAAPLAPGGSGTVTFRRKIN